MQEVVPRRYAVSRFHCYTSERKSSCKMSKNLPLNGFYRCKHCFRVIQGVVKFATHKRAVHSEIYGDPDPESSQSSSDLETLPEPSPSPAIRYRPGPKCKKPVPSPAIRYRPGPKSKKPMLRITEQELKPIQAKQSRKVENYNYVPPELITIDDSSDDEIAIVNSPSANPRPSSVNQSSPEVMQISNSESDQEVTPEQKSVHVTDDDNYQYMKPQTVSSEHATNKSDPASTSSSSVHTDRPAGSSSDISATVKSDSEATAELVSTEPPSDQTEVVASRGDGHDSVVSSVDKETANTENASNVDRSSSVSLPTYQCEFCPRVASSQVELLRHQRIHRKKKKPFGCKVCKQSFIYATSLGRHMASCRRKKARRRRHSESSTSTSKGIADARDESQNEELLETHPTTSKARPRVRSLSEPSSSATSAGNLIHLSDNCQVEQRALSLNSRAERQSSTREVKCKHCRLPFPAGKAATKHSITCRRASKNLYTFLNFFKSNISRSNNFSKNKPKVLTTKSARKRPSL